MVDIIGGIGVRLQAIADTFKQEGQEQVDKAAAEIKPPEIDLQLRFDSAQAAFQASSSKLAALKKELKEIQALQETRAQAVAMTADPGTLQRFLDVRPELEGLDERAAKVRENIVLEQVLTQETKKRADAAAKEKLGLAVPTVPGGPAGPTGPTTGDQIRGVVAGRTGGLGGLIGMTARLGLVGFAASTAFQAVGELQKALRVTGDEAFTFEGKMRNAGAELLGGNLVGGIKALIAEKPITLAPGLEERIKEIKTANDESIITEQKLLNVRGRGKEALQQLLAVMEMTGDISKSEREALEQITETLFRMNKQAAATALSIDDVRLAIERAGSEAAAFGERGGPGGRGVGGVERGRPTTAGQAGAQVRTDETATAALANTIRQSIASRTETLADDLSAAEAEVERIRERNDNMKQIIAGRAARYKELVDSVTTVKNLEQQIKTTQQQEAKAAREAQLANALARAELTEGTADNAAAYAKLTLYWQGVAAGAKANSAEAANAEGQLIAIEAAKKAQADAAAASARAGREAALSNEIAAAQFAEDMPRLRRAFNAAIAYWDAIADGTKEGSEKHEAAEAQVLSLTSSMKAAFSEDPTKGLKEARLSNQLAVAELNNLDTRPILVAMVAFAKKAMDAATEGTLAFEEAKGAWLTARQRLDSTNDTLNDLKRANARARAALTESEEDDERLIRAEIRRLERKVARTKGLGVVHQKAIQELLAAERDLAGLVDEIKPTTTVFDLLTKSTRAFGEHAGNVINASNRFTSDSFTGGIRGRIDNSGVGLSGAERAARRFELNDDRIVSSLDGLRVSVDRNTEARGGTSSTAGLSRGDVVGMRYEAMADRWREIDAANRSRAGIS